MMATGLAKSLCDAYTVMGQEIDRLRAENQAANARVLDQEEKHGRALMREESLRAENERLKADAVRLDSGRIALWGPGDLYDVDADTGHRESVQTEHSGIDLRKAIDEAIEMATPEWRATYCKP